MCVKPRSRQTHHAFPTWLSPHFKALSSCCPLSLITVPFLEEQRKNNWGEENCSNSQRTLKGRRGISEAFQRGKVCLLQSLFCVMRQKARVSSRWVFKSNRLHDWAVNTDATGAHPRLHSSLLQKGWLWRARYTPFGTTSAWCSMKAVTSDCFSPWSRRLRCSRTTQRRRCICSHH